MHGYGSLLFILANRPVLYLIEKVV
jgi:hypothetical protein